jgi:hypothetical protein
MHTTRSNRVLSSTAAGLAIVTLTAGPALAAEPSGRSLVRADLVGSMPAPASPTLAGVKPGGAPWVNKSSMVRLREDGRITVEIRGLVIPSPPGMGVNPVASVVATLVCDGMVKGTTKPFALNTHGDGATSDMISVPCACDHPAVLIQPAMNKMVYIAATKGADD